MSRLIKCLLACATVGVGALAHDADAAMPAVVLDPALQFSEGTFQRGVKWQRLVCDGLDCRIAGARVSVVTSKATNVLEEEEPLDVLRVEGKALALFPDGRFKPGKVATWYVADSSSKQQFLLRKLGKWNMPWGRRPLVLSWVRTEDGWLRYHVSDGATKQFLFRTDIEGHYGGDSTPDIRWVGDLDGDGRLDLLLSLPDDHCGYDERLYLSSNAEKGKLLYKAAQLEGSQAACGC
jgi:hypothetical protein